jgi:hypothetical protein
MEANNLQGRPCLFRGNKAAPLLCLPCKTAQCRGILMSYTIKRRPNAWVKKKYWAMMHRGIDGIDDYAWLPFVVEERLIHFDSEKEAMEKIRELKKLTGDAFEYKPKSMNIIAMRGIE